MSTEFHRQAVNIYRYPEKTIELVPTPVTFHTNNLFQNQLASQIIYEDDFIRETKVDSQAETMVSSSSTNQSSPTVPNHFPSPLAQAPKKQMPDTDKKDEFTP